jgi:hypothetical protein
LDATQHLIEDWLFLRCVDPGHANHGIGFINRPISGNSQIIFWPPRTSAKRRRSIITSPCVNAIENDQSNLQN